MTPPERGGAGTIAFGALDTAEPFAGPPVSPVPGRSAAKRARQRRRAAQRRSRVRMREGSEALLSLLVVLGLTLMLIDQLTAGSAFRGVEAGVASVIAPLQRGAAEVIDPNQPNVDLVAENQRLRSDLRAAAGDRARLRELEKLYGLVSRGDQLVLGATVVALDTSTGAPRAAVIDRGSASGIAVDQAVLAGGGLAGRVRSVTEDASVVRLISDPAFVAGARLAPSGEVGVVRGTGDPAALRLELFNPLADISQGDSVVTFGSPGDLPYPPGLPIGSVQDVGAVGQPDRQLGVDPLADVTTSSVVAVVIASAPPSPAPTVPPAAPTGAASPTPEPTQAPR